VDNSVENEWISAQNEVERQSSVDINQLIIRNSCTFQQIFAEKRYKLIIFAPKMEIVDKVREVFIIRE
jgi:hypothetical protein